MNAEILLGAGWATVLMAGALLLEWLSVHTHQRSQAFRTSGFEYDEEQDYWVCHQGEQLWPAEFDREKRLVRYRAKPAVCNACALLDDCTESKLGREITRPVDPWPHSEAGRFHRGIAVMLVVLAVFVLSLVLIRNSGPAGLVLLGPLLALAITTTWWLGRDLINTPSNFPEAKPAHGNRIGNGDRIGTD